MASQTLSDSVDRLSHLSDDILLHILSFIRHTEDVARTSLLSRRFQHLWTQHCNIRLGHSIRELRYKESEPDDAYKINNYILSVDRCFDSFISPTLHSLDFHLLTSKSFAKSNARWVRSAAGRRVSELYLNSLAQRKQKAKIPGSIFSCKDLTLLHITSCTLNKIPSNFQGFSLLTNLRIFASPICSKTLASLLSGCPSLATLDLNTCYKLTYVEVESERLKHVTVKCCWELELASFDAPNLESIEYYGYLDILSLNLAGAKFLRNATIQHFYFQNFGRSDPMTLDDYVRTLSQVCCTVLENLQVTAWLFKFSLPKNIEPVFVNLKELECYMEWITAPVLQSLVSVLHHSPNLETLSFDVRLYMLPILGIAFMKFGGRFDFFPININRLNLDSQLRQGSRDSLFQKLREDSDPMQRSEEKRFAKEYKDDEESEIWDPSELAGDYGDAALCLKSVEIVAFLGTANEMKLLEYLLSRANALETLTVADFRVSKEQDMHQLLAYLPRASPHVRICEIDIMRV